MVGNPNRQRSSKGTEGLFNELKMILRIGRSVSAPAIVDKELPPIPSITEIDRSGSSSSVPIDTAYVLPPISIAALGLLSQFSSSPKVDPEEAARLRTKYQKFRILVIGRANAGKTTVLKRVCNTTDDPVYYKINPSSKRGNHDVRDEFSFENNPGFIFHDSPGFEAGGEKELKDVMSFIQEKANSNEVEDQIHAIWFCFDPDVSRPLLSLEENFFNEERIWNVPVVAIFSKFDDLISQIFDRSKSEDENFKIGLETLEERFERPLRAFRYPPRAFVRLESLHKDEGNHQRQVGELIEQTSKSIDDLALKMLLVTVQKNNLKVCIEHAVNRYVFYMTDEMSELIFRTASWFGHLYYSDYDYGHKELQTYIYTYRYTYIRRLERVNTLVSGQFRRPSLHALTAVLICLEHSFWLAQKGIDISYGFLEAWNLYLESNHALVGRKLEDYLISRHSEDWFAARYTPSAEEFDELRQIILDNLLPRPV